MLLLENGETNKRRPERDVKCRLSADTSQIQIYTLTSAETRYAVFNRSACGRHSCFYVLLSLNVKCLNISTNKGVTSIIILTFLHALCLYSWNVWLSHSTDNGGIVIPFQMKARVPSNFRRVQIFFRAKQPLVQRVKLADFLWENYFSMNLPTQLHLVLSLPMNEAAVPLAVASAHSHNNTNVWHCRREQK